MSVQVLVKLAGLFGARSAIAFTLFLVKKFVMILLAEWTDWMIGYYHLSQLQAMLRMTCFFTRLAGCHCVSHKFHEDLKSWMEAEEICRADDSHLEPLLNVLVNPRNA